MLFAASGGFGGYWVGRKMVEAFQRRFVPDDTSVRKWHYWAGGTLWYFAMIVGFLVGLEAYHVLFPHHYQH
jgi:hypothetical protein